MLMTGNIIAEQLYMRLSGSKMMRGFSKDQPIFKKTKLPPEAVKPAPLFSCITNKWKVQCKDSKRAGYWWKVLFPNATKPPHCIDNSPCDWDLYENPSEKTVVDVQVPMSPPASPTKSVSDNLSPTKSVSDFHLSPTKSVSHHDPPLSPMLEAPVTVPPETHRICGGNALVIR